jgi:hypothetical protein
VVLVLFARPHVVQPVSAVLLFVAAHLVLREGRHPFSPAGSSGRCPRQPRKKHLWGHHRIYLLWLCGLLLQSGLLLLLVSCGFELVLAAMRLCFLHKHDNARCLF